MGGRQVSGTGEGDRRVGQVSGTGEGDRRVGQVSGTGEEDMWGQWVGLGHPSPTQTDGGPLTSCTNICRSRIFFGLPMMSIAKPQVFANMHRSPSIP